MKEARKAYENCLSAIDREINYIEYLNKNEGEFHYTNNPISALKSVKSFVQSCLNSIEKLEKEK